MDYKEFSGKVKAKFPQYADMDDRELAQKMVSKFPEYGDVSFDEQPANSPTWLESAASTIRGGMEKIAPVMNAAQTLQDVVSPGSGVPEMAMGYGQKALDYLGGEAAELGGKWGFPKTGVAVGAGIEFGPSLLTPGPKAGMAGKNILRPNVPAARAGMVAAAEELGVPLSRAEQTGSRLSAGLESMIEKTPLGGRPIQKFREAQAAALAKAKSLLQGDLGTQADAFAVGQEAQRGLKGRARSLQGKKNELFEAVPDNVNIPLDETLRIADEIIQEQSGYMPTTQNGEIISIARDIQNNAKIPQNLGDFNVKGVTTDIPAKTIPASSKNVKSSLVGENGKPLSYDVVTPAKNVPGSKEYGVKYEASPGEAAQPKFNYPLLKRLREVLNAKAQGGNPGLQSGLPGQANQLSRDYLRLKAALDKDIDNYVNTQTGPLESMVADEFKSSYKKANAFSGAFNKIFKSDEAAALAETAPERVVESVFKKNNETAIKRFRALAGDEGFQAAKQKFTQDLLESGNVESELAKYKPGTLEAIYTKPEIDRIRKYASVQSGTKTVSNLQGTQGSARSNVGVASYGGLFAGLGALARGNVEGAAVGVGQFFLPYAAAKGYLKAGEGLSTAVSRGTLTAGSRALISAYVTKHGRQENRP